MTTALPAPNRIDSLRRLLNIIAGVEKTLLNEGRVRRNPGKRRGEASHSWQKGVSLTEAFRIAQESEGYTPHARKQAEDVFGFVYCIRFIRKHNIAAEPFPWNIEELDKAEFDTREITRALGDAYRRILNLIDNKEKNA